MLLPLVGAMMTVFYRPTNIYWYMLLPLVGAMMTSVPNRVLELLAELLPLVGAMITWSSTSWSAACTGCCPS